MKRVPNDPLRGKRGTIQLHYRMITPEGITMEMTTRTFRVSASQYEQLDAFVTGLFEGTPELQPPSTDDADADECGHEYDDGSVCAGPSGCPHHAAVLS